MKSKPRSKLSYKEIEALKPSASKQTEHNRQIPTKSYLGKN